MIGKLTGIQRLFGGEWVLSFSTRADAGKIYDRLKDSEVNVEIKKATNPRSKDANAFCWALCSEIGNALRPPLSKEDVYRMAIKAVGVYTPVTLIAWDVPPVLQRWSDHGTGWFAEVMDDAGTGKKLVHLYYGSSTYTVDEMQKLLEWLTDQCRQMEIPIPLSKQEEKEMLERWGWK